MIEAPVESNSVIRAIVSEGMVMRSSASAGLSGTGFASTTAVPARIEVLVDARLRPIRLGNQTIHFKTAAPSRLFWAGRPAMQIVQALYWMQDILRDANERQRAMQILRKVLDDPIGGSATRDDLQKGFSALPIWMQQFVAELIPKSEPTFNSEAKR